MAAYFEAFVPVVKLQELPVRLFRLGGTLRFWSAELGLWIETPEGFITDGNSTPRIPIIYLLVGGIAEEACYLHDGLYTAQTFPRDICDRLLREAVIAMGYDFQDADAMYAGVRQFGQSHWNLPNAPQTAKVALALNIPLALNTPILAA